MNKQTPNQIVVFNKPKAKKAIGAKPKPKTNGLRSLRLGVSSRNIQAPVAQTKTRYTLEPKIVRSGNGRDVTVSHCEFLTDLLGSVDFTVNSFAVNPGLQTTFPWLSAMASLYESYKFEELRFEFQTESNTTFTGSVMAAVDYDASDPAPTSKLQIATYEGYSRSAPWANFEQRSPIKDLSKRSSYYTRMGALSANQDVKLYDTGNFFIATQGQSSAAVVGELYVHYRVKFMTPQLPDIAVGLSRSGKVVSTVATGNVVTAGSNVPLVPSGTLGTGPITLTATAPFNCLMEENGQLSAGTPVPVTTGSTCTIQVPIVSVSTTTYNACYELAFLPGQTFVFDIGSNAQWTGNTAKVAQYNTLVL